MMASYANSKNIEKNYQQKLFLQGSKKRKHFGLLERPGLSPSVPQVSYKVFLSGHSGSGKSYLISRMVGSENNPGETSGIEVSHAYWPMKIGNRLMLFRLELWDAGETALKRYSHMQPACCEGVDAILICFSATSSEQWKELPQMIASTAQSSDKASIIAVSTRWDKPADIALTEQDLRQFEQKNGIPVMKLPPFCTNGNEEFSNMAPFFNFICYQLWQRDQHLLLSGKER